ncbi:hypothetical protein ORD22_02315 [Sporosarcina sp. GW1-11]|uniref:hypothetical protein n=1 Tax=Sporosarcina sp. GW1-11 TaxID=2899126 RepID=UPI00294F532F|nr:hypothetical protein [Sporosarcina sp. GW1-11]MDV6377097.1 hypothetical protein [Sporosarcina sp. GW1-11]
MKLTVTELKKQLNTLDKKQLIQLFADLHKVDVKAQQFLYMKFQGEEAAEQLLQKSKEKLAKAFGINSRGSYNLHLPTLKNEIKEFEKLSGNLEKTTDLQLYFVELGTDFTVTYGDIDERFYTDMEKMFTTVVNTCNKHEALYKVFAERLNAVMKNSEGVGWGYNDHIEEVYYTLNFLDEEFEDDDE